MAASMRHRFQQNQNVTQSDSITTKENEKDVKNKSLNITLLHWVAILCVNTLVVYYSHVANTRFPQPVTRATSSSKHDFIEENARSYMEDISSFGPRPVGSKENEQLVVEYLHNLLAKFKQDANPIHSFEIEEQRTTGSFDIKFVGGFTSAYQNVNNILVKLGPKSKDGDSLLVNCHYDSVINATGASDDAVSCSLMLEVIRILSTEDKQLQHHIIFIFNGAEENILQASHGFITQHPWADLVKAFINLEAAGAGGRELLFQAGPENPWIVQLYADSVPYPYASVIGQEIFESGLVPSETDFRIYKDYGGLAGLDIAYITNGYVYHTPDDVPAMIPPGCIQRGGENLLALVRAMANSPYLSDPAEYRHGKLVFFDLMGHGMLIYPQSLAAIVNLMPIFIVVLGICSKVLQPPRGALGKNYVRHLGTAIGILLLSWTLTLGTIALLAFIVDVIGQPMSWFTNSWLLIGLYAAPSMLILLFINEASKAVVFDGYDPWDVEDVFFDANMTVFSIITIVLTLRGISSAVLIAGFVFFPALIRDRITKFFKINGRRKPNIFFFVHMLSSVLAAALLLYTVYGALTLFIPIMGRAGPRAVPDIFIGTLVAIAVVFSMSYHLGLVYVCSSTKNLQLVLVWIWLVSVIMATVTPLGFPYGNSPQSPTKQRHFVNHIERTFHDHTGYVFKHDSGLYHTPFDRYSMKGLRPYIPALAEAELADCRGPYCGWPLYLPLLHRLKEAYYMPSSAPKLSPRAYLKRVNTTKLSERSERWVFHVTGPHHVNIHISPRAGVHLTKWSLGEGVPFPTAVPSGVHSPQYFIFYSYGLKPDEPWEFWLDLETDGDQDYPSGMLEIALGAHYITTDGESKATPELQHYLGLFPDWACPIGWAATYEMWTF